MFTGPQQIAGIRGHHLFAGLSPPQMQRMIATSHVEEYESGQLLFDRGQPAQHFYIVLSGQVNLVLYSKSGEEKIVDILADGQSFAEAVMFMEGSVYPVSAVAAASRRSRASLIASTSRSCARARTPACACSAT